MKSRLFARISMIVLWVWFLFAVTGLSFGNAVLAVRDFDLTTFIWFVLYTVTICLFFWRERLAKYIVCVFTLIWLSMQSLNFFGSPEGFAKYNELFEGTHYMVPPSENVLVPNTYHIILIFLIVLAFVINVIFVVKTRKR